MPDRLPLGSRPLCPGGVGEQSSREGAEALGGGGLRIDLDYGRVREECSVAGSIPKDRPEWLDPYTEWASRRALEPSERGQVLRRAFVTDEERTDPDGSLPP